MALVDYWSLFCPLVIEAGFNISLTPNMTDNPDYLTLYREPGDPVFFEPVFNQEWDFGEPGPHIGIRLRNPHSSHRDYLRYVLNKLPVEPAAEKRWQSQNHGIVAYVWKPIPYNPEVDDWQAIPQKVIDEWTRWHLHYLSLSRVLFFHEQGHS